jgi:hypothetical protein
MSESSFLMQNMMLCNCVKPFSCDLFLNIVDYNKHKRIERCNLPAGLFRLANRGNIPDCPINYNRILNNRNFTTLIRN